MNNTVKNREKSQNTKKIKDIVKGFSILTLSFIFLLSSFSFSFANGDLPVYNSTPSNADLIQSPVYINTYYCGSNNDNCDYFYMKVGNSYKFFLTAPNVYVYFYRTPNVVSFQPNVTYNTVNYNNFANFTTLPENNSFPYLGEFSSVNAGLDYYILNGIQYPLDNVTRFPFTLQNGYLFVYDCGQSNSMYSFDLSSKSEEYSDIGSIPFPDTNQSYWFSNSLPEIDETIIPDSAASIISWQKGDKTNIFGQTQDMIATISGTSTGRYLYIYNPPVHYKWSGSSNPTASETINYPMIINGVSENENWYIYDSIARLTDFNQGGKVSGTITGEQINGSVSSDGAISLVTSSGAIYTQNSGGSTDISGANGGSLAENINGLKETLDNFVNQFIQLLSAPISHIQQLIQSSNQFFDVFSQLFDWLPSELSSVIVSGLIIMVVIGVIKMLL